MKLHGEKIGLLGVTVTPRIVWQRDYHLCRPTFSATTATVSELKLERMAIYLHEMDGVIALQENSPLRRSWQESHVAHVTCASTIDLIGSPSPAVSFNSLAHLSNLFPILFRNKLYNEQKSFPTSRSVQLHQMHPQCRFLIQAARCD
jgi:hypothetical protein